MGKDHILVVEDNETNQACLKLLLQDRYQISLAGNGTEALRIARSHPRPQLILLDIVMPGGVDGYEVCRRLQADPSTRDILIVFLTSLTEQDGEYKGLSMGAVDYIRLPVQPDLLRIRIKLHLELLHARENLKHALAKEHRANQAKSEFLANMSHEMRTPMHAILSYANFGLHRFDKVPREKLHAYFHEIKDSGERLVLLLNDLLDLAKLEAGSMSYVMKRRDIVDTIKRVAKEFHAAGEEKDITLRLRVPGRPVFGWFDDARIGQVVGNLLSNALKFTDRGKTISISASQTLHSFDGQGKRQVIEITVSDQGIGIPPQEIETIFDKFTQSSSTKSGAGGTGLGLAICRQIIQAHQGRIWAENNRDGGASFHVMFPTDKRITAMGTT